MYTYSISFHITNASTPYLHIRTIVGCILIDSNRGTTGQSEVQSVTVSLILVLGGCFDSTSVL